MIPLKQKISSWILAGRPKTLPAAVAPVLVGTSVAAYHDKFNVAAALIALFCSLMIQIATNFTNDLYDFLSGADKKDRQGPKRMLTEGMISVNEMKAGIAVAFGLAFAAGMYLVYIGGWPVLAIGVASILAGIAYTAGPFPLAYNGLGDLFVFIFFGIVATVGTFFVQALYVSELSVIASLPMGALITNILIVNNYRDAEDDKSAGKHTTAVLFGKGFARAQYILLSLLSYAVPVYIFIAYDYSFVILLPLLGLPLSVSLIRSLYYKKGRELNRTLELTAKLSVLYAVLFSFGMFL